jgi:hypothetical protein|tara:strand:+ start:3009 stop:3209 length:201 start_codon:yes stop_codon:yes gene_type:complete
MELNPGIETVGGSANLLYDIRHCPATVTCLTASILTAKKGVAFFASHPEWVLCLDKQPSVQLTKSG